MFSLIEHLYIHIPFCTHLCPYCGFYKTRNLSCDIRAFLPALAAELRWARENFHLRLRTVYFGGGTPSALSTAHLESFFQNWPWREVEEFTLECNPATISKKKAELLRAVGVNRISLGVQSFDPHFLQLLGRTHNRQQVRETFRRLREAGFDNINVDLMFALPGQTLEHWGETLEEALEWEPQHISAYNLTAEEDTEFFRNFESGTWKTDKDLERESFLFAREFLEQRGFVHYEVSNFARPGWESIHNRACWRGRDYLGLGPGACSTVGSRRWQNVADVSAYAESIRRTGLPERTEETLSPQTKLSEKIFLGLRTREGIATAELAPWKSEIDDLLQNNLAEIRNNRFLLTPQGLLVADEISEIFV